MKRTPEKDVYLQIEGWPPGEGGVQEEGLHHGHEPH